MYFDANWEAIRAALAERLATNHTSTSLDTSDLLDQAAEALVSTVNSVLEDMVLRARPSPYTKR